MARAGGMGAELLGRHKVLPGVIAELDPDSLVAAQHIDLGIGGKEGQRERDDI